MWERRQNEGSTPDCEGPRTPLADSSGGLPGGLPGGLSGGHPGDSRADSLGGLHPPPKVYPKTTPRSRVATHTAEYQGYTYKGVAGGRFLGDNLHFSEVSSVGSMGHFVDLDQENASVWSPSPEAYLEKTPPHKEEPGERRGDKPSSTSGPQKLHHTSHTPTRAGIA